MSTEKKDNRPVVLFRCRSCPKVEGTGFAPIVLPWNHLDEYPDHVTDLFIRFPTGEWGFGYFSGSEDLLHDRSKKSLVSVEAVKAFRQKLEAEKEAEIIMSEQEKGEA